jgi:hypothetical protein
MRQHRWKLLLQGSRRLKNQTLHLCSYFFNDHFGRLNPKCFKSRVFVHTAPPRAARRRPIPSGSPRRLGMQRRRNPAIDQATLSLNTRSAPGRSNVRNLWPRSKVSLLGRAAQHCAMASLAGDKENEGVSKSATMQYTSKTFHDPEPNIRNAWQQYRWVWRSLIACVRVCAFACSHLTLEQEQADVRKVVAQTRQGALCHRYSPHDWGRF